MEIDHMRKAGDICKEIVQKGFRELARNNGFTYSHLNYHRRTGSVIQVVFFQLSSHNIGSNGLFYINIGFSFDEVNNYESMPIIENPKYYECDFWSRLEYLIKGPPHSWDVSSQTDTEEESSKLNQMMTRALECLNKINSLSSFMTIAMEEKWFPIPGGYKEMAFLQEVNGDIEASQKSKELFQEFLVNRKTMTPNELLKFYGFPTIDGID